MKNRVPRNRPTTSTCFHPANTTEKNGLINELLEYKMHVRNDTRAQFVFNTANEQLVFDGLMLSHTAIETTENTVNVVSMAAFLEDGFDPVEVLQSWLTDGVSATAFKQAFFVEGIE